MRKWPISTGKRELKVRYEAETGVRRKSGHPGTTFRFEVLIAIEIDFEGFLGSLHY